MEEKIKFDKIWGCQMKGSHLNKDAQIQTLTIYAKNNEIFGIG